jgi:hypothetical protein
MAIPENIPADIAQVEKDIAVLRTANTTLYADAQGALTALTAANATIASQASTISAQAAEIAALEAELNPPPPPPADPPSAPTDVVATAGVDSATVTWEASAVNGSAVTGYLVTASGAQPQTVTGTSADFTGLTAGTPYTFSVVATSAAGDSLAGISAPVTPTAPITPPPPPPPPPPAGYVYTTPTNVLLGEAWLGITYMPEPTVTMASSPRNPGGLAASALGATSWIVVDMKGDTVAQGTIAATAETVTVCNTGTWAGGATAIPGHYTLVALDGDNVLCTGNFVICPPNSPLWEPPGTYGSPVVLNGGFPGESSFSAWLAVANDRTFYNYTIDGHTPAQSANIIITNVKADAYFQGPQDPARPRMLWIAPDPQATAPTQNPTPAEWASLAQALVAADLGFPIIFELPTNEPENGGWTQAALEQYVSECVAAVQAVETSILFMGWDSGGIFADSPITALASFLTVCGPNMHAFSNHMENSTQTIANLVSLRAYAQGIKTQVVASGYPNLDYWNTETGLFGGLYGVLHPRRDARTRTLIPFVFESFGWAKEHQYDFEVWDAHGANQPNYQVDVNGVNAFGNMRAGAYAHHVMGDALFGTTCTPQKPPAKLSFGPVGSVGDSLFMGSHYTGTERDVVVVATNVPSAVVTLKVSATGTVTYWDGMGVPSTVEVVNGEISVPTDDLLTYVFLPTGSTVSVVDTDQGAVAFSSAINLALSATCVNETGAAVPSVHDDNWNANAGNTPGSEKPYIDTTLPATVTFSNLGGSPTPQPITGFAFSTSGPAWQTVGCGIVAANVEIDDVIVWSYTDKTATSQPFPSASNSGSADPCTRTTWWTSPFAFVVKLPEPITGSAVKLTVTETGYGGEPDLVSSLNSTNSYHEGSPQVLQLAEFQIYG